MLLKVIQQATKKMITFWIDLGPILAPVWPPNRGGSDKNGPLLDLFWALGASGGQDAPQERPRPSPRAPKRPQDPSRTDFGPTLDPVWWIFGKVLGHCWSILGLNFDWLTGSLVDWLTG